MATPPDSRLVTSVRAPAFQQLLSQFPRRRVLVLGDMVADEYVVGKPVRISREAPVLILHHSESFIRPGGATNTAYNIAALGACASVVGMVGDDEMGRKLQWVLAESGIDTAGLVVDPNRPTSTKTRILAKGTQEAQQQIVRIDRVDGSRMEHSLLDTMIDALRKRLETVDALLISDYDNGVISHEVIDACLPRAQALGLAIIVDSHGDLFRFRGVTAATPNQPEAEATLRMSLDDKALLEEGGARLLEGMDAAGILITRGSEGLVLFERDRTPYYLPVALASHSLVVDPNGAGDTVAAVFTLSVACGASLRQAAYLSNVAGGEAVRKIGPATLSIDELLTAAESTHLPPPEQASS